MNNNFIKNYINYIICDYLWAVIMPNDNHQLYHLINDPKVILNGRDYMAELYKP